MRQFVAQQKADKTKAIAATAEGFTQDCDACHKPIAISREVQRRMATFLSDHSGATEFFLESEPLEKDNDMVSREFKIVCGSCGAKHILRVSYRP